MGSQHMVGRCGGPRSVCLQTGLQHHQPARPCTWLQPQAFPHPLSCLALTHVMVKTPAEEIAQGRPPTPLLQKPLTPSG